MMTNEYNRLPWYKKLREDLRHKHHRQTVYGYIAYFGVITLYAVWVEYWWS